MCGIGVGSGGRCHEMVRRTMIEGLMRPGPDAEGTYKDEGFTLRRVHYTKGRSIGQQSRQHGDSQNAR